MTFLPVCGIENAESTESVASAQAALVYFPDWPLIPPRNQLTQRIHSSFPLADKHPPRLYSTITINVDCPAHRNLVISLEIHRLPCLTTTTGTGVELIRNQDFDFFTIHNYPSKVKFTGVNWGAHSTTQPTYVSAAATRSLINIRCDRNPQVQKTETDQS